MYFQCVFYLKKSYLGFRGEFSWSYVNYLQYDPTFRRLCSSNQIKNSLFCHVRTTYIRLIPSLKKHCLILWSAVKSAL